MCTPACDRHYCRGWGGRASKGAVTDVGKIELVAGRWKLGRPSLPPTHTRAHRPFSFLVQAAALFAVGQIDYQDRSRIARYWVTCSAESGWNPETCNRKAGRIVRILSILDCDALDIEKHELLVPTLSLKNLCDLRQLNPIPCVYGEPFIY